MLRVSVWSIIMGQWMMDVSWCALVLISSFIVYAASKKNIVDLNEADVERIFQEWEEKDEDTVDWGEAKSPSREGSIDLDGLQSGKIKPEDLIRQSKKDKPVMIFVGVKAGNPPDRTYTEKISSRWMQSLHNAHQQVQRYVVADDRVLFLIEDGSKAWNVKDYLVTQTECTTVAFEQLTFECANKAKRTEL